MMLTKEIVEKLNKLGLNNMANEFEYQQIRPDYQDMSFEDRLDLLINAELDTKNSNTIAKLMKQANFENPNACIEDIKYFEDRNLNSAMFKRLGECEYINNGNNVVILGATGCGKTYLACALGVAAVRKFIPVKYYRMPDLFTQFNIAEINQTVHRLMKKLIKCSLLIIDEWSIIPTNKMQSFLLLDILNGRLRDNKSTIICSQYDFKEWNENIADEIILDSIRDRLLYSAYKIYPRGESMRKRLSTIKNL